MGTSLLIVFILLSAPAAADSCGVCHGKAKVDFEKSIHRVKDISCVHCHGGDPSDMSIGAMSVGKGFRGPIKKKDVPGLCAGCHSNVKMMLQYGEYVDQLSIYRESVHGRLLYEKGDTKVAVCTDCHGVHDIKMAKDPASSVYKLNVPLTCAKCHSDKEMMSTYGIPTDQFEKYKGSVHGVLRLEKRDLRSPGCPECHGVHGAHPPGVSEVHNICGQCHVRQRDYFQRSPHVKVMMEKKFNECASCHGSHGIQRPNHDLFVGLPSGQTPTSDAFTDSGQGCLGCHEEGSQEALVGAKMKTFFIDAEKAISEAEKEIEMARLKGFDVDEERVKVEEARARVTEALPAVHALSVGIIEDYTKTARMNALEVRELVDAKIIEWRDRRVMFVSYIVLFLAIVVLLFLKRRRLSRPQR